MKFLRICIMYYVSNACVCFLYKPLFSLKKNHNTNEIWSNVFSYNNIALNIE